MRRIAAAGALAIAIALQVAPVHADPVVDDMAKTCLSQVQGKDFGHAKDTCTKAIDHTATKRLQNAIVLEALAQSDDALRNYGAQVAYLLANRDANIVFRSPDADAESRASAGQVLDRTSSRLKSMHLPVTWYVSSTDEADSKACSREANVLDAAQPDYPVSARSLNLGLVTTLVNVSLDENGAITGTRVIKSSGNAAIDASSEAAARGSIYTPKLLKCKGVPGDYLFRAEFSPD